MALLEPNVALGIGDFYSRMNAWAVTEITIFCKVLFAVWIALTIEQKAHLSGRKRDHFGGATRANDQAGRIDCSQIAWTICRSHAQQGGRQGAFAKAAWLAVVEVEGTTSLHAGNRKLKVQPGSAQRADVDGIPPRAALFRRGRRIRFVDALLPEAAVAIEHQRRQKLSPSTVEFDLCSAASHVHADVLSSPDSKRNPLRVLASGGFHAPGREQGNNQQENDDCATPHRIHPFPA